MSHEGIRFVSQDEARGEDTPKLTGDAIRPAKVKVDKSGGTGRGDRVEGWAQELVEFCVAARGLPLCDVP